jgi:hypothetical protein
MTRRFVDLRVIQQRMAKRDERIAREQRQRARASTVTTAISVRERSVLDEIKAASGLASDSDVTRVALYRFAVHLDVAVDTSLFHVRAGQRHRPPKVGP